MRRRIRRFDLKAGSTALAVLALVVLTLAVPGGGAQAATSKRPTVLVLSVPATLELGAHPVASVRLTSNGAPVAGQTIAIRLGGRVSRQVVTGADGRASADIARDLGAGKYQVVASFAGTAVYRSSTSATVTFTVNAAVLTIVTVPALPDTPLIRVGRGATLKTGADGTIRVPVNSVGQVALTVALPADDAMRRLRLDRWDDGSTEAVRLIRIPDTLQVTIAIDVSYPVRFSFSAANGATIDVADVPAVGISDSAGVEQTLAGLAPYWLQANAITRLTTGLDSAPLDYRIVSVVLDGADVVNRGQQRFVVDSVSTIKVELLVFFLDVQGRDALLKFPTGSSASIVSVAGSSQVVELDAAGHASVRLPRGEYRLLLHNGLGYQLSTPVALSRDQGVDVLFVSLVDMAIVLGAAIVAGFGLIVIGRPHVLGQIRRRSPRDPSGSGETLDPGLPVPSWPDPTTVSEGPRRVQRPKEGP